MLHATARPAEPFSRATPAASAGAFFFPGQFAGRPALAAVAEMVRTHTGRAVGVDELAQLLGVVLPCRVGVQELLRAGELAGLPLSVVQLRADGLATPALPLLVLVPTPAPAGGAGTAVWLVAHCDGRYVVTRDHATATPANRMGPLHDLTDVWAPNGEGWALCAEVPRAPT